MSKLQVFSAANLTVYDQLIKGYIDTEDAKSIKTVAIDGNTLKFYKISEPVGSSTPAYSITLPTTDLSGLIAKVTGATAGNIPKLKADGTIEDSGIAYSDIATSTDISGIENTIGTVESGKTVVEMIGDVSTEVSTLDSSLADVAKSGDSDDVSYDNTTSGLTATNVQDAIDEVASASSGGVGSKTVYITETFGSSSDTFSKKYGIYQGATGSSASPVVGEKLVDIDIPKDMVVESGSVVDITFNTSDNKLYDGAVDVTSLIVGASGTASANNAGKYIKLIVANATSDKIYIAAKDLVDIYTAQASAAQIQIAIDNNNVISASIVAGSVTSTELASNAVTTAKIADGNVTLAKLSSEVSTAISTNTSNISALQTLVGDGVEEIPEATIRALFS